MRKKHNSSFWSIHHNSEASFCERKKATFKTFIKKIQIFTLHKYNVALKWLTAKVSNLFLLTHIWPMFPFYTPWKHQKTCDFLVFSGGTNGNIDQKWVKEKNLWGWMFLWQSLSCSWILLLFPYKFCIPFSGKAAIKKSCLVYGR